MNAESLKYQESLEDQIDLINHQIDSLQDSVRILIEKRDKLITESNKIYFEEVREQCSSVI